MQSAVTRILDHLEARRGPNGAAPAGGIAWPAIAWPSPGALPPLARTQKLVSDLTRVLERLDGLYTPTDARIWLYASHPLLDGERPVDRIVAGHAQYVLAIIESLDQGTYT